MSRPPATNDFDGWVAQLGRKQRRREALGHLLAAGPPALPALRRGLKHPKPDVRRGCASVLDHLMDQDSVGALVAALEDEDAKVKARVLHALACDRCKQNDCRPGEDEWVPKAMDLARNHPDPDVRAAAIDALGKVAGRLPHVGEALLAIADQDAHPAIRNIARIRTGKLRAQLKG